MFFITTGFFSKNTSYSLRLKNSERCTLRFHIFHQKLPKNSKKNGLGDTNLFIFEITLQRSFAYFL